MQIRSKKRVSRKVSNKKNKSKRSKSKKERTRRQNIRKQGGGGGDEPHQHGSICTDKDPKFIHVAKTYQKDNQLRTKNSNTRTGEPKVLICKKSLKIPFTKRKRSSTLPTELQEQCLDQPCYHITTKFDRRGKKNKEMIKDVYEKYKKEANKNIDNFFIYDDGKKIIGEIINEYQNDNLKKDNFYQSKVKELLETNNNVNNYFKGLEYDLSDDNSYFSKFTNQKEYFKIQMQFYFYSKNKDNIYKKDNLLKLFYYQYKYNTEKINLINDLAEFIQKKPTIEKLLNDYPDYKNTINENIKNKIKNHYSDFFNKLHFYEDYLKRSSVSIFIENDMTPEKFYRTIFETEIKN
jgi:hypothetical protein